MQEDTLLQLGYTWNKLSAELNALVILIGTAPTILSARLTKHIVYICAFLTNFGPELMSPPETSSKDDVDTYFAQILECDFDDL